MLKKARWVVGEAKLRVKYMTSKNCIFCQIVKGAIKSKVIAKNDGAIAINDINPVARVHILVIPKKHIDSVLTIEKSHGDTFFDMFDLAKKLVSEMSPDAFRLTFNGGKFQHVGYVHMHLLAGSKIQWEKL